MAAVIWHGRELVVLMGPPGAGKSTYASGRLHVTTDALRAEASTNGAIDPKSVERVYDGAFAAIIRALRAGRPVVLDTPAVNPIVRQQALRVARAYRAKATLVYFTTPLDVCIARQVPRTHPVPAEVVERMHAEHIAQLDVVRTEGWDSVMMHDGGWRR